INAWRNLQTLSKNIYIPAAEQENIVLNLLRLDPYEKHSHPEIDRIWSLKDLWSVMEAAPKVPLNTNGEAFVFTAAQTRLATEREALQGLINSSPEDVKDVAGLVDSGIRLSQHGLFTNLYRLVMLMR
ncbi:MAG: hypothetical protein K8I00_08580, partial [Candidatus Omnitrophica bacterium]|nr:hypothetical protein [Candidatus Omnitrophota bacterium]